MDFGWWSVLRYLDIQLEPWRLAVSPVFHHQHCFRWDCLKSETKSFLERRKEQKFLSKGRTVEIPIITKDLTVKIDLIITPFLHGVNMMSGFNLLQVLNPLIDWFTPLLPKEVGINQLQVNNLWSIVPLLRFSHRRRLAFLCCLVVCLIRPKRQVPLMYCKIQLHKLYWRTLRSRGRFLS